MTYTTDWFTGNIPRFQNYLEKHRNGPAKFLEIGCWEGRSTVWFLENILIHQDSTIYACDTFDGGRDHKDLSEEKKVSLRGLYERFLENIKPYQEKVVILKGESQVTLRDVSSEILSEGLFDFVYVDGSHESVHVLEDAVLAFRLLKKDGLMIFDDYEWRRYEDETFNPQLGIDAFLDGYKGYYEVIEKRYQIVIRKIKDL
jgi:predicted O-methyltransferase YrrM